MGSPTAWEIQCIPGIALPILCPPEECFNWCFEEPCLLRFHFAACFSGRFNLKILNEFWAMVHLVWKEQCAVCRVHSLSLAEIGFGYNIYITSIRAWNGMRIIQSCSNHHLNLYRLQVINITTVLLRLHAIQTPVRAEKSLQIIGWDVQVLKWLLFPILTSSGHWLLVLPVVTCEDQPKHWLQRHWHPSWKMALSWQDRSVLFIN